MPDFPTPHGDRLRSLLRNRKLPEGDHAEVREAIQRYDAWIAECEVAPESAEEIVQTLTSSLNSV